MLKLAYFVELTWLLVDMFSGYLQNHDILLPGNQTASGIVRILIIALFSCVIVRYSKNRVAIVLLLLMGSVWVFIHALGSILDDEITIVADAQFHLKIILPVLFLGVFQVQMRYNALDKIKIRRIILLNGMVLMLNLSLGLFGIGFGNYGESATGELLGSKGFFYAGNEVSATLVAIFALIMFIYRDELKKNSLPMLFVVTLFFIASLLSLSKTSLLGFFLVMLFVVYNFLSIAKKVRFGAMIFLSMLISAPYWMPLLQVAIERWAFFWDMRSDFFNFVTSGRTERIEQYINWLTDVNTPWQLIFGEGQVKGYVSGSFENDLLDLTMNSGFFGLLIYGIWISWASLGLLGRVDIRGPERFFTPYMIWMFIVLSIVAGHVIYSATLAPFIALLALTSSQYFPGNSLTLPRQGPNV